MTAVVIHLADRRPAGRRLPVDNAAATLMIAAAFQGAARARAELASDRLGARFPMDADLTVYWPTVRPEWEESR